MTLTTSIEEVLERNPLSSRQLLIVFLCFAVSTFDGLDLAIMGFIAPAIRGEWHINPGQMAMLFSAGLIGLSFGALMAGLIADKFGRKWVLVFAVLVFGVFSFASSFSRDVTDLLVLRVLTGLGLGAAAPNAITLTSEFCPPRLRSFLVTAMFCGFTLGSAAGGTIVVPLILPHWGWRGVFIVIGSLPVLLLPFLIVFLPESIKYLLYRGWPIEKIRPLIRRVCPRELGWESLTLSESQRSNVSPLKQLFGPLWSSTILLWTAYFINLLTIYLLSNWLPTVLSDLGSSISVASFVVGLFQVGGTLGALVIGYLMDRLKSERVLSTAFFIGALAIASVAYVYTSRPLLAASMFAAGACVSGSMTGLNALTSQIYPTSSRATGVGWALGIGRFGSVIGSSAGAWIFGPAFSFSSAVLLVAAPITLVAFTIAILGRVRRNI